MSSATGLERTSSKIAFKPDLKQSLRFLERDRVQSKEQLFVHQSTALLEKKRRKAIDKRFNDIVTARHRMNKIQSSLDTLAKHPIKSPDEKRMLSLSTTVIGPEPVVKLRSQSPIPGFKYHYNGDEKRATKRLSGVEQLGWAGSHLVENKTYERWRKTSKTKLGGVEGKAGMEESTNLNNIAQRVKAGAYEPGMRQDNRRSAVTRYENNQAALNPGASFARGYRKRIGPDGRRMMSFLRDQYNALDEDLKQRLGGQSRSEIVLAVWTGTGPDAVSRKSADRQFPTTTTTVSGKERGRNISLSFRKPEMADGRFTELKRNKEAEVKIRHFLEEVHKNVQRRKKDGPSLYEREHNNSTSVEASEGCSHSLTKVCF